MQTPEAEKSAAQFRIRRATLADVDACAEIYAHFVRTSNATFETEVPSSDEMAHRTTSKLASHDWIVAFEPDGNGGETVLGFAYAGAFRDRAAYDWMSETTIYLRPDAGGRGIGTALYSELLERMRRMGIHSAVALVAVPNDASAALHTRMGFECVGQFKHSGYKLGAWHDVRFYQKVLVDEATLAGQPQPIVRNG